MRAWCIPTRTYRVINGRGFGWNLSIIVSGDLCFRICCRKKPRKSRKPNFLQRSDVSPYVRIQIEFFIFGFARLVLVFLRLSSVLLGRLFSFNYPAYLLALADLWFEVYSWLSSYPNEAQTKLCYVEFESFWLEGWSCLQPFPPVLKVW